MRTWPLHCGASLGRRPWDSNPRYCHGAPCALDALRLIFRRPPTKSYFARTQRMFVGRAEAGGIEPHPLRDIPISSRVQSPDGASRPQGWVGVLPRAFRCARVPIPRRVGIRRSRQPNSSDLRSALCRSSRSIALSVTVLLRAEEDWRRSCKFGRRREATGLGRGSLPTAWLHNISTSRVPSPDHFSSFGLSRPGMICSLAGLSAVRGWFRPGEASGCQRARDEHSRIWWRGSDSNRRSPRL